jgi:hypothetical protein
VYSGFGAVASVLPADDDRTVDLRGYSGADNLAAPNRYIGRTFHGNAGAAVFESVAVFDGHIALRAELAARKANVGHA